MCLSLLQHSSFKFYCISTACEAGTTKLNSLAKGLRKQKYKKPAKSLGLVSKIFFPKKY
jgi:hypothetical protein